MKPPTPDTREPSGGARHRQRCRYCIHDEHLGMCTGRNGGTAYVCPCIHDTVHREEPQGGPHAR